MTITRNEKDYIIALLKHKQSLGMLARIVQGGEKEYHEKMCEELIKKLEE